MENGKVFKRLLQTPNFRIVVVEDSNTVEICGALKVLLVSFITNSVIFDRAVSS